MPQIELVEFLSRQDFRLARKRYDSLKFELDEEHLPECHILSPEWLTMGTRRNRGTDVIEPRFLWWHGRRSFETLEVFLRTILGAFSGSADLVVYLREKDSTQLLGYRVRDGKVTSHKVQMSLGEYR